jgi:glycerol-3-phosphate acyltransferase PlsY
MTEAVLKGLLAYALGNLMGGHLVGWLRGGIDLRTVGSGNVGATNALRTQGTRFALLVLAIDVGKGLLGALAVPALPWPFGGASVGRETLGYLCGAAVTLGHCYPAAYGFRGGKGVATLAGVFGALLPLAMPLILAGFVLVVMLTGYVSLATITAALLACLHVTCFDPRGGASALGAFTAFMAMLVLFKHRENIVRLARGDENRFEKLRVLGRWLGR